MQLRTRLPLPCLATTFHPSFFAASQNRRWKAITDPESPEIRSIHVTGPRSLGKSRSVPQGHTQSLNCKGLSCEEQSKNKEEILKAFREEEAIKLQQSDQQ